MGNPGAWETKHRGMLGDGVQAAQQFMHVPLNCAVLSEAMPSQKHSDDPHLSSVCPPTLLRPWDASTLIFSSILDATATRSQRRPSPSAEAPPPSPPPPSPSAPAPPPRRHCPTPAACRQPPLAVVRAQSGKLRVERLTIDPFGLLATGAATTPTFLLPNLSLPPGAGAFDGVTHHPMDLSDTKVPGDNRHNPLVWWLTQGWFQVGGGQENIYL